MKEICNNNTVEIGDKDQSLVSRIITLYAGSEEVSEAVVQKFSIWLTDGTHAEEKDEELMKLWNSIEVKPRRSTLRSLAKIKTKLLHPIIFDKVK